MQDLLYHHLGPSKTIWSFFNFFFNFSFLYLFQENLQLIVEIIYNDYFKIIVR